MTDLQDQWSIGSFGLKPDEAKPSPVSSTGRRLCGSEFVGGSDIMMEMFEAEELGELMAEKGVAIAA